MKIYYTFPEIQKRIGVNRSTVLHWEKKGFDLSTKRVNYSVKGERIFTPLDIQKIKTLKFLLKERGYTLDGARKEMLALKFDI